MSPASGERITLSLTPRQAQALRDLATLAELPPEVYAEEVLVKYLYHAFTPDVARRAAEARAGGTAAEPDRPAAAPRSQPSRT